MVTIGVDQSLISSENYEHRCLGNIIRLYKFSCKCDNQQMYKAILEASMAYTPEGFTENSPMLPREYVTVKNPSARKSLRQISESLDVNLRLLSVG